MLPHELDFIFPFVVLAYGVIVTFVTCSPFLMKLAENQLPSALSQQLKGHRILALVCVVVGGLWSLQNIWLRV